MRRIIPFALLMATPVLAAGDVPAPESADQQLAEARREIALASAEEQRLTAEASRAGNEAQRLAGEQRAAAAAISAAEARIDAAEAELALARGALAARHKQLAERQAPVAGLLAGLVTMGRRPPLLALADGSAEEFVRVRALLDATMPAIRVRTVALSGELAAAAHAERTALAARDSVARERVGLTQQRARFAALEQRALSRETQLAGQALGAGDTTLAGGETLAALGDEAARRRAGLSTARELALLEPLPARPAQDEGKAIRPPLAYQLPVDALLSAGLGSVDSNGVRSRGLRFVNPRGAIVSVPADGTIVFAGPYRRSDGVVIIDHGGGWLSLMVGVGTALPRGTVVRRGDPLGRALGPVELQLSRGGTNVSPAFIAASSAMLSNGAKGG